MLWIVLSKVRILFGHLITALIMCLLFLSLLLVGVYTVILSTYSPSMRGPFSLTIATNTKPAFGGKSALRLSEVTKRILGGDIHLYCCHMQIPQEGRGCKEIVVREEWSEVHIAIHVGSDEYGNETHTAVIFLIAH